jgi:hypothetical protein
MESVPDMKRFSQMSPEEIRAEVDKLQEEKKHAEFPSQLAIIESKIYTALSYTLPKEQFPPGTYRVVGYESPMQVKYLNGVMAWGLMADEEASFPISMLQRISPPS